MTELPKGWALSSVGDLGEYINGRGFKKSEWSTDGRPIIRIQNLTGSGSSFNYFDGPLEDRYVVPPGSLLVSWAATLGVYTWGGPEGALNQHIFKVESFIDPEFHRYVLEQALDLMRGHTHGSGMVHITRGRFDETPIPVPPLAEQARIVAAIEEAISLLDAGETALHNTRTRLKRMRDSVLTAAVTGQLVPQDPTDTPASKSLHDFGIVPLAVSDASCEIPESWAWCRVYDLLSQPLANGRSVATRDSGFPVLRLTCLRDGGIDLRERKGGDWTAAEAAPFLVADGDFLVSRGNGSLNLVGRGGLIRAAHDPVAFPDTLIRVRVNSAAISPELLEVWWRTGLVRRHIESRTRTTAGIYKINQGVIEDLVLPVPPCAEQLRIVAEVERQFSFIEAAERAVEAGSARARTLRRSVLKAAFEGRLVEQDPGDESASELLERIAAERASSAPKKRAPGRAGRKVVAS